MAICVIVGLLAFPSTEPAALAAPSDGAAGLDGPYTQGPLHETYTVQQWISACGPAPSSSSSGGGEAVTVRQSGDELLIQSSGAGARTFRSDRCYDPLPSLKVDSHSHDASGPTWRTHCATDPSDPRRATIQSLISVSSGKITVSETGRYEITLAEGTCIADIHRDRSFTPASTPAAVPSGQAGQAGSNVVDASCTHPGVPVSLEIRPAQKRLRAGDSLLFRATVRDAAGCALPSSTHFQLASDDDGKLTIDDRGTVIVAADASEIATKVLVTAAGKTAASDITVISGQHYDDLLASGELDSGSDEAANQVSLLAPSELGGEGVRGKNESARRRTLFIVIVGACVLGLGVLALIGRRRARAAARLEQEALERHHERVRDVESRRGHQRQAHAEQLEAHQASVLRAERAQEEARRAKIIRDLEAARATGDGAPLAGAGSGSPVNVPPAGLGELPPGNEALSCSTCRRDFPPRDQGGGAFCPFDATRLTVARPGPHPSGSICPTCHRGYPPGVRVCAIDGDELAPVALVRPAALAARGKICPTCGARFEGAAGFCGKDGTSLVLLN